MPRVKAARLMRSVTLEAAPRKGIGRWKRAAPDGLPELHGFCEPCKPEPLHAYAAERVKPVCTGRASHEQASMPCTENPSRSRVGTSPQGGQAWSKRPCHTVATWTAWDRRRDLHFVSRKRWWDQPRPAQDAPGVEVPPPFPEHTLPLFKLALDLLDP